MKKVLFALFTMILGINVALATNATINNKAAVIEADEDGICWSTIEICIPIDEMGTTECFDIEVEVPCPEAN